MEAEDVIDISGNNLQVFFIYPILLFHCCKIILENRVDIKMCE
jgi:hypothetical protein